MIELFYYFIMRYCSFALTFLFHFPFSSRFSSLTVKDHATVTLEGSDQRLSIGTVEIQFAGTLKGEKTLLMDSNEVILQPGSYMDLSGGGYGPGDGPGKGQS